MVQPAKDNSKMVVWWQILMKVPCEFVVSTTIEELRLGYTNIRGFQKAISPEYMLHKGEKLLHKQFVVFHVTA